MKRRILASSLIASGLSILLLTGLDWLLAIFNSPINFFPKMGPESIALTAILIWILVLPASLVSKASIIKRCTLAFLGCMAYVIFFVVIVFTTKSSVNLLSLTLQCIYLLSAGVIAQLLMYVAGEFDMFWTNKANEK